MNPSFKMRTLIATSETISTTSAFTLPSNIESGSPTFTFSAKLYCTGTVNPPSCSNSPYCKITSSSLAKSRRLFFIFPRRIFGPCRSCKIATLRPFLAAASRIHLICWSRSSFVPCEQFNLQPFTPAIIASSIISAEFVDGPIVANILVLLNNLLINISYHKFNIMIICLYEQEPDGTYL